MYHVTLTVPRGAIGRVSPFQIIIRFQWDTQISIHAGCPSLPLQVLSLPHSLLPGLITPRQSGRIDGSGRAASSAHIYGLSIGASPSHSPSPLRSHSDSTPVPSLPHDFPCQSDPDTLPEPQLSSHRTTLDFRLSVYAPCVVSRPGSPTVDSRIEI